MTDFYISTHCLLQYLIQYDFAVKDDLLFYFCMCDYCKIQNNIVILCKQPTHLKISQVSNIFLCTDNEV